MEKVREATKQLRRELICLEERKVKVPKTTHKIFEMTCLCLLSDHVKERNSSLNIQRDEEMVWWK